MKPSPVSGLYLSFDAAVSAGDADEARDIFLKAVAGCGLAHGGSISVRRYEKLDVDTRNRVFGPALAPSDRRDDLEGLFLHIEETLFGAKGYLRRNIDGGAVSFEIIGPSPDKALLIPGLTWVDVAFDPGPDRQMELHHMFTGQCGRPHQMS